MSPDAFFIKAPEGQRFCLFHQPPRGGDWRGVIVYVHPFAEEMNKARRMAALAARQLAAAGYAVLQIDLHGCGDSSGDFGDASWQSWRDDVLLACAWLQQRSAADLWLWGLRSGGLLAAECAAQIAAPSRLLLWQPVVSGKQYLQQFLRLKLASEMQGGGKGLMERLRQQLADGESIEVAGYRLSPALANGLEAAELSPSESVLRVEWIESSATSAGELSPLARSRIEAWQAIACSARGTPVKGPAFWQTAEIAESPELLAVTLQVLG